MADDQVKGTSTVSNGADKDAARFRTAPTRPGAEWHADIDSYGPAGPAGAGNATLVDQVTISPRAGASFRATPFHDQSSAISGLAPLGGQPASAPPPQPSRWSRWSPTRTALAIAVRAGFTALMLGKKLVSTT